MTTATTPAIVAPWTEPLLEPDSMVPITAETVNGYRIVEITSLEELRAYFREGSYLRISNIRGYWLHVPTEEE